MTKTRDEIVKDLMKRDVEFLEIILGGNKTKMKEQQEMINHKNMLYDSWKLDHPGKIDADRENEINMHQEIYNKAKNAVEIISEVIENKKEFVYKAGTVTYKTVDGSYFHIYLDPEASGLVDYNWKSVSDVEKSFDEMLSQCGSDCDAENRTDLFVFMYACYKGWIKEN